MVLVWGKEGYVVEMRCGGDGGKGNRKELHALTIVSEGIRYINWF